MKKFLIVMVILLMGFSVFALDCSVEAGIQKKQLAIGNTTALDFGKYFVETSLYQDISLFTFYTIYRNEMDSNVDSWQFSPRQDYFKVGVSFEYRGFSLNIEHECLHPTQCFDDNEHGIYGGYTQFSVKYSILYRGKKWN